MCIHNEPEFWNSTLGYWSSMLSQFMFYVTDTVWNYKLFIQGSTEQIHCSCSLFGLIKFLNLKHCLARVQMLPCHSRHKQINHVEISSEIWFRQIEQLEAFWKGVRTVEPRDCPGLLKFTHVIDHLPRPTGSFWQPCFLQRVQKCYPLTKKIMLTLVTCPNG